MDNVVKKVLEDLEKNHNHSWAQEVIERNKLYMDNFAIIYRGNKITYKEMIEKSKTYARSLKFMGYKKGDEIPVCMSNTPEFVYILMAVSLIGCKINCFPEWIDKEYMNFILNNSKSKTLFFTGSKYEELKQGINSSNIENLVVFSLSDSLPLDKNGEKIDPYESIDNSFANFNNNISLIKNDSEKNVLSTGDFEKLGENYHKDIEENVTLDDEFTITYSSGTTAKPKAILHQVRSYITVSRFKDKDVSGMGQMSNIVEMAHIPTYTHVALTASYSDVFFEHCTVAPEPIYKKEAFPFTLLINKPNYVNAGPGFWIYLGTQLTYNEQWKKINFPELMLACVTGQGMKPGQEKFLNKVAREHKFGTAKLPFPISPVTMSIGGGTSEHTGIFVTLFKAQREKLLHGFLSHKPLGLTPAKMAEVDIVDESGKSLPIGATGQIVISSPCTMKSYYYDEKLTSEFFIDRKDGKNWSKAGAYGIKSDKAGRIYMKGRFGDDYALAENINIPIFQIEDAIELDTKNILAATIISDKVNNELIAHVELQPSPMMNIEKIYDGIMGRIANLNIDLQKHVYIRFHNFNDPLPLSPSGKTDTYLVQQQGYDNVYSPVKKSEKVLRKVK